MKNIPKPDKIDHFLLNSNESAKQSCKNSLRYHQIADVNELRWMIEQFSGFTESSQAFWIILQFARYLKHNVGKRYISNNLLARLRLLIVQQFAGFIIGQSKEYHPEEVLHKLQNYLDTVTTSPKDPDQFKSTLFNPYSGDYLGKDSVRAVQKYTTQSTLSTFPVIPSRRTIGQLSGVATLKDCYNQGFFLNVRDMWNLLQNGEKVELKFHVPRTVALQFRLMALFCDGRPEDMMSTCILFAWERLGRILLKHCRSTHGLTEIFNALVKELNIQDQYPLAES